MKDLEPGKEIAGRYRVVRLVGKGGMGAVYEVTHVRTGQRLAMKVLASPQGDLVERLLREARAASSIPSDHVVRVTDADVSDDLDGAPFLVMELLEGRDLEREAGDAPAASADVVLWLRQAARALDKAHELGIVHRDLKPENLFLTHREDGAPLLKVLDFGIARMATEAGALTRSGQFLGTPTYMAPEQADTNGTEPVTARADLYAIGLVAFRLLTGHVYWKSGSLAQLLAQILTEPLVPPSHRGAKLGSAFDAWFLRACDRDPKKRFGSAYEQVEALAAALDLPTLKRGSKPLRVASAVTTLEVAPTLSASSRELRLTRSRRRWWIAGSAAAAAAALALFSRGDPRPAPRADAITSVAQQPARSEPARASAPNAPPPPASAPLETSEARDATVAKSGAAMASALPRSSSELITAKRSHVDAGRAADPLEGQY